MFKKRFLIKNSKVLKIAHFFILSSLKTKNNFNKNSQKFISNSFNNREFWMLHTQKDFLYAAVSDYFHLIYFLLERLLLVVVSEMSSQRTFFHHEIVMQACERVFAEYAAGFLLLLSSHLQLKPFRSDDFFIRRRIEQFFLTRKNAEMRDV